MDSGTETEDENFSARILSNLFRKESNGEAIEFFVNRRRLGNSQNHSQLEGKLNKLKYQIEKCGGYLGDGPSSCHSIELVFPEDIDNINKIDSDVFKADYIDECIKCDELLDLEDFRLGKSPYSSIDINMIMKGLSSWNSVSRTSPQKGRKLSDFGLPVPKSSDSLASTISRKKTRRVEYSIEEDLAILKFLLAKNLYDKVGGNATWKIVHREFPNHSYQSLHNRFRRFIVPNLSKYKGLTDGERNLFNRHVSSDSSSVSSPKKAVQADICSPIRKDPLTVENPTPEVEQKTVTVLPSVTENVSDRNATESIRNNTDSGCKMQASLDRLEKTSLLRVEDVNMEDNTRLTPNTIEMMLSILFRKESNGTAIEFYMRRNRFSHFQNCVELEEKCRGLKEKIEKYGGFLGEIPTSCHSIELVFPEVIDDTAETEADIFKADYVDACVKYRDLLDIEAFRLGESPYDGSIDINSIMKGNDSWDSATRRNPRKGRKLPDFESSPEPVKDIRLDKKIRNEYLMEEDLAILKFLVSKNLHDKIGGNATWKIVQREFPNHSVQSLRNRFSRHILPNIDKYEGLTDSERNHFLRHSSTDDSCTPPKAIHKVSIPVASELPKIVIDETSPSTDETASDSVRSSVSSKERGKRKRKCVRKSHEIAREFTVEVDKCILQYIIMHKRYAEVFGTKLWMDIQGTIFKQGDWKSIKRRFLDVIVKNIESEEYSLDQNVIRKFLSNTLYSSSEDQGSFDEDDCSASSYKKKRKYGPRPYTFKEDKLIIDYIVRKERYAEIRGKCLWVDIQDKVLHGYNRTWESARNRFLRTLFKDLSKFLRDPEIIAKFQHGAVVERHLGGFKDRRTSRKEVTIKNTTVAEESDEDPLPKHPALPLEKIATPSKKPKRQLFRQPIIPLPILFTSEPGPLLTKKKGGSLKVDAAKVDSAAATAERTEQLKSPESLTSAATSSTLPAISSPKTTTASSETSLRDASFHNRTRPTKLRPAPSLRCLVLIKKLTNTELEKYGCKAILTQKIPPSPTRPEHPITPVSVASPQESPPNASRFTVEISPDLLAARLSAAGSSVSVVAQASQEPGWLPLSSSLSRESLRNSIQPLKASSDNSSGDTGRDVLNKCQQSSSVTGASLNIESCEANNETHGEADVPSQVCLSARTKICDPIRTKNPTHSYLDSIKDDLSSDGYLTPEG